MNNTILTKDSKNQQEKSAEKVSKPKKSFLRSSNKSVFKTKIVQMRRVSKSLKGGKKLTFSAVVIVGDETGRVGVGIGRANDANVSVEKATYNGKKNLVQIPLTKNDSIPHLVNGSFGACDVLIKPAGIGTGVVAGGPVRAVLELAGIKNVSAKQLGSNNIINNARATIVALNALRDIKTICAERSISFKIFRNRIIN
jgi:small subunit ribosomal protein S5